MRLSRYWLLLGVAALAVAGLFSLVLVIARTPSLASLPLFNALFHKALVVHVDLSVLVWFLSMACLLWSLLASTARPIFPFLEEGALICFALGILAITLSPLDPHAEALMSNYIPVITSPVFFLGLGLLLSGVGLMLMKAVSGWRIADSRKLSLPSALHYPLFTTLPIALIAILSFFWSYRQMPGVIGGQQHYEMLFWGGGHVLQLLNAQVMMVAWVLLAQQVSGGRWQVSGRIIYILFSIGLIAALMMPIAYLRYDVASLEHRQFFTRLMIWGNGIAPVIMAFIILPALWRGKRDALWSMLGMSLLLFLYGGVLGGMIEGQNVVIPAHYHGSIVGVTLAFMGLAYLLLPRFDWRDVRGWKLAFWQPIVYGGGQLLHISGLAWSGGYGVLRKTPGGMDAVAPSVKAAMGLMGLGGILAIIGGFMFVIVVVQSVMARAKT